MAPREYRPGRLDEQDLFEALSGLLGLYASHDLYTRYCDRAEANGREPEADQVFYRALTHYGYVTERVRTVNCRVVASTDEPFPATAVEPVKRPVPRKSTIFYTP